MVLKVLLQISKEELVRSIVLSKYLCLINYQWHAN
ncbi:hypothetical protein E2C01_006202 [Portunus trituberculatus]|uniref:Uncharacterized protein n=1 Tax=Portunus trituberculatus TaxID=210409 RepID=A0A5B7CUH8_PORTR|nr:hypothetical protein [Portunus trituberculatus]